jgi:phage tail-like protein
MNYRWLDAHAGWDQLRVDGLTGLADPTGLRLGPPGGDGTPFAVTARYLPPPRLARDGAGRIFVAADGALRAIRADRVTDIADRGATAIAAAGPLLALCRPGEVDLVRSANLHPIDRRRVSGDPLLVALTPWSLVAVVTARPCRLWLIGLDGLVRTWRCILTPAEIGVVRLPDGETLAMTVRPGPGRRRLYRIDRETLDIDPLDASELCGPPPWAIEVADDESWAVGGHWFGPDGEPTSPPTLPARPYATEGLLVTQPLDAGATAVAWHRVRVDADRPPGTAIEVGLATGPDAEKLPDPLTGPPLAGDDALVDAPPGRYLQIALRLTGDGTSTPVVRGIRADFDTPSGLSQLPSVYAEDPDGAEFTRRFLALFEAGMGDLDEVIRQAPLILHPDGQPDHVLGPLARLCGINPDPSWPAGGLRRLLARWPEIGGLLGTPDAVAGAVEAVYDVRVAIRELGRDRPWAAAGQAELGRVRLFGMSTAPIRLGSGKLGAGTLDPGADPLAPAYSFGAFRCVVHVPPTLPLVDRPGLEALVRACTPAHVALRFRYASHRMTVGVPVLVGVDTSLGAPPRGVLGEPGERAVVLGRGGPLAADPVGGGAVTVGRRP